MKNLLPLGLSLVATIGLLAPVSLSAQIINIDFLSKRGSETAAPNYVGQGAAGGGTIFNGLAADNTAETDYLTVGGTDLLDSYGTATTVGFSIALVGADNQGTTLYGPLNGAYLFLNSGNNVATSSTFTITGLGSATEENLFFTTSNVSDLANPTITFTNGGTETTFTTSGIFTSANTIEFQNVAVVGGTITGSFDSTSNNVVLLSALTIAEVPEPSTWALMGLGAGILVWRLRRTSSTI